MASLSDISPRINNIITQVDQQTIPTVNTTVSSYKPRRDRHQIA